MGWGKAVPVVLLLFCLWQVPGGSQAASVEINVGSPEMPIYVTQQVDSLMDRRHAHVQQLV